VQKLVLYSSVVFDRQYEEVLFWRLQADKEEISQEDAQKQIDSVYIKYQDLKSSVEAFNMLEKADSLANIYHPVTIYSQRNEYTFNFDIPFDYLLQLQLPILTVYGTEDLKSRDCERLPMFFTKAGKDNLTMMPVLGCDHFFVKKTKDSMGVSTEEYMGNAVLSKIEEWLSK
jgi:alpha/beta superfamily hydrolase